MRDDAKTIGTDHFKFISNQYVQFTEKLANNMDYNYYIDIGNKICQYTTVLDEAICRQFLALAHLYNIKIYSCCYYNYL